jgi:hypothetical protein
VSVAVTPRLPSETERAWAAGFFDGEGWIGARLSTYGRHVHIGLENCDLEALRRFRAVVGVGNIWPRRGRSASHSPSWVWRAGAIRDVEGVVALLWPWLTGRRREQADSALKFWREAVPKRPRAA